MNSITHSNLLVNKLCAIVVTGDIDENKATCSRRII